MFKTRSAKNAGPVFIFLILTGISIAPAQTKITIHTGKPGVQISPTMYGIFFEDINFGADGGLYAELVKNRGFEFPEEAVMGWSRMASSGSRGSLSIRDEEPFEDRKSVV